MNRIKTISTALFISAPMISVAQESAIQLFKVDTSISIRAIAIVNDSVLFYGGSKGSWGYTESNGKSWKKGISEADWQSTDFRSIAMLKTGELLMANIASPGFILKSNNKGLHWQKVYTNNNEEQFFDALVFSDEKNGWALGDPQQGCIQLLRTANAGNTWTVVDCKLLPVLEKGEAFFASSNTSIDAKGNHVLIATGGSKARVLYSHDKGKTWNIVTTPIQQGDKMTGIFSLAMYNEKVGVIAGGNYDDKANTRNTFAYTVDGGKTWKTNITQNNSTEITQLPFISCVQFVPGSNGKKLLAACLQGVYYSENFGQSWKKISNESFYTLRIAPTGKTAWFAGSKGFIGKLNLNELKLK